MKVPKKAGIIRPDCLYTLDEIMARTNWGPNAFRTARRQGLQVLYSGGKAFVMGSAFIAHIQATAALKKAG